MYYIKAIQTYHPSCKKNTANKNSGVRKTKQNRFLMSNCAICGRKNQVFH